MPVAPNIDGFLDAMTRFRDAFGRDAVFVLRGTESWPSGTQLDPETGRPYDPTIVASSASDQTATIPVIPVTQQVVTGLESRLADNTLAAIGRIETGLLPLLVDSDVWDAAPFDLAAADVVTVFDEDHEIVRSDIDGIANEPGHRHILVIQQL